MADIAESILPLLERLEERGVITLKNRNINEVIQIFSEAMSKEGLRFIKYIVYPTDEVKDGRVEFN